MAALNFSNLKPLIIVQDCRRPILFYYRKSWMRPSQYNDHEAVTCLHARRYRRSARTQATVRIPTHHATAVQISLPTAWPERRLRIASTIAVTGWCSANHRTGPGIDSVGTKAEEMNGRKIRG